MRAMYWPNEPARLYPGFRQEGGRAAFAAMAADGTISALETYSYLPERARYPDQAAFETAALAAIDAFAPDILFVQHLAGSGIADGFWRKVLQQAPGLTLVYHEADVFGRWIKRLDRGAIAGLRHAHLVFACGLGSVERLYRQHTRAPILFKPHCFLAGQFARHDPAAAAKTAQVAMIANRGNMRRLPGLYMPGGRRRARFASRLSRRYGKKFALYGKGWSHLEADRGPMPYADQEAAIQSARISANWDHFDTIESYFSDRLPISLAAAVPHVTTWHKGYDALFSDCPGLYACKTLDAAIDACAMLLARSDDALRDEGLAARAWVMEHLEARSVFRCAFEQAAAFHAARR